MNDKLREDMRKAMESELNCDDIMREEMFTSDEVALLGMGISILAIYTNQQLMGKLNEEEREYNMQILEDVRKLEKKLKKVLGI